MQQKEFDFARTVEMTNLNISIPTNEAVLKPKIVVVGVGGAGGNAVNNMITSNLEGVDFVVCNTDSQALAQSEVDPQNRIQLGPTITNGLGAGARPEIGRASAEEALDDICDHLQDANMIFITAGMGGGTGTGAAPIIAKVAREKGILTVGVITKPFHFEGRNRMRIAEDGIRELQEYVDTLIIIPNQNLFRIANEKTTFADAFKMADDVLYSGVRGVTDLMVMPGLINLDFADIRTVMSEMGKAMMGTGQAEGEGRATEAAESAISNPLLDDVSMKGARGMLINITGGLDMTLFEVDEAANRIREEVDPDANIIFGSTFDEELNGLIRVSVVATGIDQMEDSISPPQRKAETVTTTIPQNLTAPTPQNVETSFEEQPIPSARTASEMLVDSQPTEEMTSEQTTSEYFMAEKPAELDAEDEELEASKKKANPFAEAAMDNAGKNPRSKSGLSFGFFSKNSEAKKKHIASQSETVTSSEPIETNSLQQSSNAALQPELKGFEQKEEQPQEKAEDEILEIPAFLRRQAN